MVFLSKSNYLIGLQCPKYLWVIFNNKEIIPEVSAEQQHILEQGLMVENHAKKLFPEGIEINKEPTEEQLKMCKPLFEAKFVFENIHARADILKPVNKNEWDIIEVKSGTKIKDVNLHDLSFQKYCYEKAGLKIRKACIMHINNRYIRKAKLDLNELFIIEDMTEDVNAYMEGIDKRIDKMFQIIKQKEMPETGIHIKCNDPYPCKLKNQCWKLPDGNVFELYRNGRSSFELFDQNIVEIKDVPNEYKITAKQRIQIQCAKEKVVHVNKEEVLNFLKQIKEPEYFLDFECFNPAIPVYENAKPYQQIPFQFSLHVRTDDNLIHYSYIADGSDDPREKFIEELKKVLGTKGSILVYNQRFEKHIINSLAEIFPKYKKWAQSLDKRFVDLWIPFKNFYYYNPKQKGSASIKYVLPALTNVSYEGLAINNGLLASSEFLRMALGDKDGKLPSEEEIENIRKNLEEYCGLDTEAMIFIVDKLKNIAELT
ncbi:MAG: DUF2779 domain-containing protein [Nanoarchaeota archaeon]|nr:DUF2779 domain-containing protein [Nanoarchaeota archaeon]